ncbi:amidohydrolase family protein [Streptacidiphilus sp. P02-A3a]|uniref:amidohydrolase family protein n=1 Tax=Streptacidiphilus sp. P02-A3a TaxID=2704468 RepID=UPI001CDBE624|nr:amidohydrolase family protein [Streptacidiphilus sp. P02-A3a]
MTSNNRWCSPHADRHGVGVDIHLHDPGESGAAQLRAIAERTRALGLDGRVTVSHAYCLGELDDRVFAATAGALADSGVSVMTNGPAGPMPPVLRLRGHGVRVFAGSDNIRTPGGPTAPRTCSNAPAPSACATS